MALLDQTANIIVRDQFSNTFSNLHKQQQQAGRGFDDMGRAAGSAGGALSKLGGVAGALGITLGVAGAIHAGKAAIELGNLGAQSLVTKQSFESVTTSVGRSTALLDQMKIAAGGTVDEMRLMQLANTALAGASGETGAAFADLIPKLIEGARAANKLNPALGDTEFLFQSLVTGIKRGSPLLIDNTGITLSVADANQRLADSLGKSVAALTEEEKQLALMQETARGVDRIVAQAGGNLDTMATSADKLKVAFQELKVAIGEALAPTTSGLQSGLAGGLNLLTDAISSDKVSRTMAMLEGLRVTLDNLNNTAVDAGGALSGKGTFFSDADKAAAIAEVTAQIKKYEQELRQAIFETIGLTQASDIGAKALIGFASKALGAASASVTLSHNARAGGDGLIYMAQSARIARGSLSGLSSDYKAFLESGKSAIVSSGVSAGMSDSDILANLANFQKQAAQIELDYGPGNSTNKSIALERLREQYRQSASDYKDSLKDMVDASDDAFSEIAGIIDSNLQPSFSLGELAPGLLPQEGNIDEHYRRLAAIALRGQEELSKHAGDWADTIALIPPDVQAQGVQAMQDWAKAQVVAYDQGLDFSFIDKNMIKDRILKQLQANEARDAIIAEIAASMEGVSLSDIQTAAKDAGLGGGVTAKVSVGVTDSIDTDAMLKTTAAAITLGATKYAEQLKAAGGVVGGVITDGITTAVTNSAPDIVNKLAYAIAPSVEEIIARKNRRAGESGR